MILRTKSLDRGVQSSLVAFYQLVPGKICRSIYLLPCGIGLKPLDRAPNALGKTSRGAIVGNEALDLAVVEHHADTFISDERQRGFDNSKIKRFVPDYCATRFSQGIRRTIEWFQADPARSECLGNIPWDKLIEG